MGYGVYEDRDAFNNSGVKRWAGYEVPGVCDYPDCHTELVMGRGLGNKCEYLYGDKLYAEKSEGCGLFFCGTHLMVACSEEHFTFTPKPDTAEWIHHMNTDESWAEWRKALK